MTTRLLRQAVTELRDAIRYHELERIGRGAKPRREVRTEIAMLTETPSIDAPAHEFEKRDEVLLRQRRIASSSPADDHLLTITC